MQLEQYTADEFLGALRALLPPGDAWQWPEGGTGTAMLRATAQELVRANAQVAGVLDLAVERHRILALRWADSDYLAVAKKSQTSKAAQDALTLARVSPLVAGFSAGAKCWSIRAKFILVVRYDGATVDQAALWDALLAFKQAHVFIWLVNTGTGPGVVWHVQN